MSDDNWNDDGTESSTMKELRKLLKDREKEIEARDATIAELQKGQRTTTLRALLADEFKVNAKVASLVPADVAADKEAVGKWLQDYGDVLGLNKQENDESKGGESEGGSNEKIEGAPSVPPELVAAWQRTSGVETQAGSTTPDIEQAQISLVQAMANASGGNFDSFLGYLRGENSLPST